MTQPTSVNMTFDTSLVDLNTSFSTTESDPSDPGLQAPTKTSTHQQTTSSLLPATISTPPPKPSTPVQHIPTQDAYNQWASVYDTDGNMLQSIDDLELSTLLPDFLGKVIASTASAPLELLDLGCGTGRNTAKLLTYAWPQDSSVNITGLDFSAGMLGVAKEKLQPLETRGAFRLAQADCFPSVANAQLNPRPDVPSLMPMDALISTLVLEHIPLSPYFATVSSLLKPGAYALITNMHSEMGCISQAGFVNEKGVKVRGTSFAHTPQETVEEARRAGFEVLSLKERSVEKADVESGRVGERGGKWIGINVWYGIVVRKL